MRALSGIRGVFALMAGVGAAGLAGGCEAPIGVSPDMASVWVQGVTVRETFDAAEATFREQGFRFAQRDPARGYLRSEPAESVISGGTGRLSDEILKPRNEIRRVAEAYVTARDDGAAVRYRVMVERLDTAKVRAWSREHQVSDAPVETPIDQDQATLPAQNETWTPIRRDASLESQFRSVLLERLGRSEAGTASP